MHRTLLDKGETRFVLQALRERWDAAWLNLPVVGKLARGYNAARFAGTLSMLTAAGGKPDDTDLMLMD